MEIKDIELKKSIVCLILANRDSDEGRLEPAIYGYEKSMKFAENATRDNFRDEVLYNLKENLVALYEQNKQYKKAEGLRAKYPDWLVTSP